MSGHYKTKSVLFRLLTQSKEAPKKRNRDCQSDKRKKKKWKRKIMSKIEKKLQFPYVVQAQFGHRTVADIHLQHHCA